MATCQELLDEYNLLKTALASKNQEISDLAEDITVAETTCINNDPWNVGGHTVPTLFTLSTVNTRIDEINSLFITLGYSFYAALMTTLSYYYALRSLLLQKADLVTQAANIQTNMNNKYAQMQAQNCELPP